MKEFFVSRNGPRLLRRSRSAVFREKENRLFAQPVNPELKDITVCFTGHRSIPPGKRRMLRSRLDRVLRELYQRGYRRFLCGGALGLDTLAEQRIESLRKAYPDARLILALPCASQANSWPAGDRAEYDRLKAAADEVYLLSGFYYRGCMQVRNRYMVDSASFCVCYLHHVQAGGTLFTVSYALRQDMPVLNLDMPDACRAFLEEKQTEG